MVDGYDKLNKLFYEYDLNMVFVFVPSCYKL